MTHDHVDPYSPEGLAARVTAETDNRIPAHYRNAIADNPAILAWAGQLAAGAYAVQALHGGTAPSVRTGPSLLLLGPTGTGKTYQAYGALRAIAQRGVRARWVAVSAPDLYARMRPRHGIDSEGEFRTAADAGVLFLDDLGAAKGSEWTEEVNYRLINHRYENELPTLITSNVPPPDFAATFGDRVTSRLAEMCTRVALVGDDRRRKPQQ